MTRPLLNPTLRHPLILPDGTVHTETVYLNQVIDHPNITVGDFSYYSAKQPVTDHAAHLAPYLYPNAPEKLIIGKFGQFAHGVKFITASANHPMGGVSTYPFRIFNPATVGDYAAQIPARGDTVIGNDVWLGFEARIMPGVTVGDGAIVGACSVVTRDVPPYCIVAGNPAQIVRRRFPQEVIDTLLSIRWWDWDIARIEARLEAIETGDIATLSRA